eukprot:3680508-Amphidinium_carterae.1
MQEHANVKLKTRHFVSLWIVPLEWQRLLTVTDTAKAPALATTGKIYIQLSCRDSPIILFRSPLSMWHGATEKRTGCKVAGCTVIAPPWASNCHAPEQLYAF